MHILIPVDNQSFFFRQLDNYLYYVLSFTRGEPTNNRTIEQRWPEHGRMIPIDKRVQGRFPDIPSMGAENILEELPCLCCMS